MQYGALGISYYSSTSIQYDDPVHDSYYNPNVTRTNHAVDVIGWDDTFPKENFAQQAPGDGAWLIRNSWGDEKTGCAQTAISGCPIMMHPLTAQKLRQDMLMCLMRRQRIIMTISVSMTEMREYR